MAVPAPPSLGRELAAQPLEDQSVTILCGSSEPKSSVFSSSERPLLSAAARRRPLPASARRPTPPASGPVPAAPIFVAQLIRARD